MGTMATGWWKERCQFFCPHHANDKVERAEKERQEKKVPFFSSPLPTRDWNFPIYCPDMGNLGVELSS